MAKCVTNEYSVFPVNVLYNNSQNSISFQLFQAHLIDFVRYINLYCWLYNIRVPINYYN